MLNQFSRLELLIGKEAVGRLQKSKVAVFGCLNPVFGAILSALILRESGQSFGIKEIIALVLISGGIFIVQKEGILDDSSKSL